MSHWINFTLINLHAMNDESRNKRYWRYELVNLDDICKTCFQISHYIWNYKDIHQWKPLRCWLRRGPVGIYNAPRLPDSSAYNQEKHKEHRLENLRRDCLGYLSKKNARPSLLPTSFGVNKMLLKLPFSGDDIWNFDTTPQNCSPLGPYKLPSRCKHHLTINMSLENTHILFFWHIESLKVSSTHIFRAWQSEDLEVILVQAWEVSRWRASQSQDPWYWARYRLTKNKRKRQKDPWHWWTQYWDWPWRWGLNDWEYLIVGWRFTCSRPQLLSNQRL